MTILHPFPEVQPLTSEPLEDDGDIIEDDEEEEDE